MKEKIIVIGVAMIIGTHIATPTITSITNNIKEDHNLQVVATIAVIQSSVTEVKITPTSTPTPPKAVEVAIEEPSPWTVDTVNAPVYCSNCLANPQLKNEADLSIQLAQSLALQRGWGGNEWDALYQVWMNHESSFVPYRMNGEGACGIAQFLPCSKLVGEHTARNEIVQGMNYISGRYGDPLNALYHENIYGWY